jgi:hypothetical protein
VRSKAQGLLVDGYGDKSGNSVVWSEGWQANGMDARQGSLFRVTLIHGYAWLFTVPADDGGVLMRPEAATRVAARYADPGDEWPEVAVRRVSKDVHELYDVDARYILRGEPGRAEVEVAPHGLGVCPAAQVRCAYDLLGHPIGEVEPVIPIQDRIVDATFNLQMVAKYGAWPQRWIAGMTPPDADTDGEALAPRIKAYVDSLLLAADPDTKFGQFAAADLGQFVEALEAHIRHLAAITQTPPHYLLGSLVNLSAEALAAAESGLQRRIRELRESIGDGLEQSLRLGAAILGDDVGASDTASQVHWQDVESRSLAQTSDALLKLGQLGVPRQKLFRMIPGWTQTDADEASAMIEAGGGLESLLAELAAGQTSPTPE